MAGLFGSNVTVSDPSLFNQGARDMSELMALQARHQKRRDQQRLLQSMPKMPNPVPEAPPVGLNPSVTTTFTTPVATQPVQQQVGLDRTGRLTGSMGAQNLPTANSSFYQTQEQGTNLPPALTPSAQTQPPLPRRRPYNDIPVTTKLPEPLDRNKITAGIRNPARGYISPARFRGMTLSSGVPPKQKAQDDEALDWYNSDEADEYFKNHVFDVEKAENDPIGFYKDYIEKKSANTPQSVQETQPAPTPSAQTQPVGITKAGPTRMPVVKASATYAKNPRLISHEISEARRVRSYLAYQAQYAQQMLDLARRTGDTEGFAVANKNLGGSIVAINKADNQIVYYAGVMALQDLELGDPSRAASVYSYLTGRNIDIIGRPGNNFDLVVDGRLFKKNMTLNALSNRLRTAFDKGYREANAKAAEEYRKEKIKSDFEIRLQKYKSINEAQLKLLEQNGIKVTNTDDGAIVTMNGKVYKFDSEDATDPNGNDITVYSLKNISPIGTGTNPYITAVGG